MRTRVLIVAKTRQGGRACIGAISMSGQSMRLIAPDAATNEHANLEYRVGDVWEIEYQPAEALIAPHVENVLVWQKQFVERHADPVSWICQWMPPKVGGLDVLYDGLVQRTMTGALYVTERTGLPSYSTHFWQTDRPLVRATEGKRIRYRYMGPEGTYSLVFVGFQEPLAEIPAGALLRVSLAHHWRAEDRPNDEERCYVQLSGWFLPSPRKIPPPSPFEPTSSPEEVLKQVFGYDEFRPLQEEIVDHILQRRDALVVMPTGGGKSLCYQIPALIFSGLTVVVSPLIALMQDQVEQLRSLGVAAAYLNSTLDYDSYVATMQAARTGKIKLLYVAPETLLRPETLLLLEESRLACLAIDEAHCISEWGHDFRPEYRQLIEVRRRFPQAVCVALTATATPRVRADIQRMLGLDEEGAFVAGFDRPNLFLSVAPRGNALAQVLDFVAAHPDQQGIIYCSTREQVDTLASELVQNGISALPYHAGLDDETRKVNQRCFVHDQVPVMVATIAFGMGINKPDVRFVLHHNLPSDLETYYQQVGRAGRDGLRADCLLLHSARDVQTHLHFIRQGAESEAQGRRMRLDAIARWAESMQCRRTQLLAYFGEEEIAERCGMCDVCVGQETESAPDDLTIPAQMFLSCMARMRRSFGIKQIIRVLRGSRDQKVLQWGHDRLSTYGIGARYSQEQWQHLAQQFIGQGLVVRDLDSGTVSLTERGRAVLRGQEQVRGWLHTRGRKGGKEGPQETGGYDPELFAQLRTLRRRLADEAGIPAYIVFPDRTLQEMATYFPQSVESLARIHGVGRNKLETYADAFLEVLRGYCQERNIQERRRRAGAKVSGQGSPRTREVVDAYHTSGSLAETALSLGITVLSVLYHLRKHLDAGNRIDAEPLRAASQLASERQEEVLATFARLGAERLKPVFDEFQGDVPYEELHLLRLYYRATSM